MASMLPKEETIIDPLYEPLKLNRYELCPHLTMLSNVSHLSYGFSPYLLFDVEGWKEVVGVIKGIGDYEEIKDMLNDPNRDVRKVAIGAFAKLGTRDDLEEINSFLGECKQFKTELREYLEKLEELLKVTNERRNKLYVNLKKKRGEIEKEYKNIKRDYREILNKFLHGYLFSYDCVSDEDVTLTSLVGDPNIDWVESVENPEIKNDETILIHVKSNNKRWGGITIDKSKEKGILTLDDGKTHDLKVEDEDGKLNIYLNDSNKFKENFGKIAHLFQLEYPVKVKCPKCDEKQVTEQFMCEEGKIYSMKEALLRTFELRRARWLQMSGSLHTIHRASTHTRLSHQIGSMIAGVNALREIDVYPRGDVSMSLGEYLLMSGELHEFLMANFLHDIGHSPLSHVLEPNPFIELDHEEITKNLILGKAVKGEGEGKMDWYVAERYLLKMKAIKDFEHRFFKNQYDPIYRVCKGEYLCSGVNVQPKNDSKKLLGRLKDAYDIEAEDVKIHESNGSKTLFICKDNKKLAEIMIDENAKKATIKTSDDRTYDLKVKKKGDNQLNIYVDQRTIFLDYLKKNDKILESEVVTVSKVLANFGVAKDRVVEILSGKLLEIEDGKERQKTYDTQFLNKLVESEIDIDRMDHVKRDSVVCGLSLTSFRLLELLGSMSVVLPDSDACTEIYNPESDRPYILISENGLLYVMDLLNARKSVFNDVLYSDTNNWINGVVNQITSLAVRSLPHITIMLPFITDQILMHLYTNDLFLGTQIEKLNKLFHGKADYSTYMKPMRFKLKEGVIVTEANLEGMYKIIEAINDAPQYKKLELPAVVFYTNIKPTKCPVCRGPNLEVDKSDNPYIKVIKCNECEYKDENGEVARDEVRYLVDVEEDIFKLSKCPICGAKIEKRKDFIECKEHGKMRKWSEENWDPMLVYGKKFKVNDEEKYLKFKKLVGKYKDTSRGRFPERPSELDVKNLFYVWVNNFVVNKEEKITDTIKKQIGQKMGGNFEEGLFVNLDRWRGYHGTI